MFSIWSQVYKRGHPRKRVPYICNHTAPVPPHATAAPRRRPTEGVRNRGAPKAAVAPTSDKFVTLAVFHAPMFALNAFPELNACAPSRTRSTPNGECSHCSTRIRALPNTHGHGVAAFYVAIHMDIATCIYIKYTYAFVTSMSSKRGSVRLAHTKCTVHSQLTHKSARVCIGDTTTCPLPANYTLEVYI